MTVASIDFASLLPVDSAALEIETSELISELTATLGASAILVLQRKIDEIYIPSYLSPFAELFALNARLIDIHKKDMEYSKKLKKFFALATPEKLAKPYREIAGSRTYLEDYVAFLQAVSDSPGYGRILKTKALPATTVAALWQEALNPCRLPLSALANYPTILSRFFSGLRNLARKAKERAGILIAAKIAGTVFGGRAGSMLAAALMKKLLGDVGDPATLQIPVTRAIDEFFVLSDTSRKELKVRLRHVLWSIYGGFLLSASKDLKGIGVQIAAIDAETWRLDFVLNEARRETETGILRRALNTLERLAAAGRDEDVIRRSQQMISYAKSHPVRCLVHRDGTAYVVLFARAQAAATQRLAEARWSAGNHASACAFYRHLLTTCHIGVDSPDECFDAIALARVATWATTPECSSAERASLLDLVMLRGRAWQARANSAHPLELHPGELISQDAVSCAHAVGTWTTTQWPDYCIVPDGVGLIRRRGTYNRERLTSLCKLNARADAKLDGSAFSKWLGTQRVLSWLMVVGFWLAGALITAGVATTAYFTWASHSHEPPAPLAEVREIPLPIPTPVMPAANPVTHSELEGRAIAYASNEDFANLQSLITSEIPPSFDATARAAADVWLDGQSETISTDELLSVLATDPDNPRLRMKLAWQAWHSGEPDAAVTAAIKAVDAAPASSEAWALLAGSYAMLQDPIRARSAALIGLFVSPDREIYLHIQLPSAFTDTTMAREIADQIASVSERVPVFGSATESNGPLSAASPTSPNADTKQSVAEEQDTIGAMLLMAIADDLTGLDAAAASMTAPGIAATRDAPKSRRLNDAGIAALNSSDNRSAISLFEAAVSADASSTEALNNLGYAQYRSGLIPESLATFRQVLAMDPRRAAAWGNLGEAMARRDEPNAYAAFLVAYHFSRSHQGTIAYLRRLRDNSNTPEPVRRAALQALGVILK